MKEKWKKFGKWFSYTGTDGDNTIRRHTEVVYDVYGTACRQVDYPHIHTPAMIQLFYVALSPEWVVQLAWLRPDLDVSAPRTINSANMSVKFRL